MDELIATIARQQINNDLVSVLSELSVLSVLSYCIVFGKSSKVAVLSVVALTTIEVVLQLEANCLPLCNLHNATPDWNIIVSLSL